MSTESSNHLEVGTMRKWNSLIRMDSNLLSKSSSIRPPISLFYNMSLRSWLNWIILILSNSMRLESELPTRQSMDVRLNAWLSFLNTLRVENSLSILPGVEDSHLKSQELTSKCSLMLFITCTKKVLLTETLNLKIFS